MLHNIANAEKNLQILANSAKNFQRVARMEDSTRLFIVFSYKFIILYVSLFINS